MTEYEYRVVWTLEGDVSGALPSRAFSNEVTAREHIRLASALRGELQRRQVMPWESEPWEDER